MDKKIIDYIVLDYLGWSEISRMVMVYKHRGYQPVGGVTRYGSNFAQAMVKYET